MRRERTQQGRLNHVSLRERAVLARTWRLQKRKLSRSRIASLLATAVLVAAPVAADARTTQIQILTRGTAFGGHSFAGVGQYEFITGIATGEVGPTYTHNSTITDLQLAPRNTRGNVVYQHNFYILQPLDPSKGNHKVMYQPPNRGGRDLPDAQQHADLAPTIPQHSPMRRRWTTRSCGPAATRRSWSGWENNLAALNGAPLTGGPIPANGPVSTASFSRLAWAGQQHDHRSRI